MAWVVRAICSGVKRRNCTGDDRDESGGTPLDLCPQTAGVSGPLAIYQPPASGHVRARVYYGCEPKIPHATCVLSLKPSAATIQAGPAGLFIISEMFHVSMRFRVLNS